MNITTAEQDRHNMQALASMDLDLQQIAQALRSAAQRVESFRQAVAAEVTIPNADTGEAALQRHEVLNLQQNLNLALASVNGSVRRAQDSGIDAMQRLGTLQSSEA